MRRRRGSSVHRRAPGRPRRDGTDFHPVPRPVFRWDHVKWAGVGHWSLHPMILLKPVFGSRQATEHHSSRLIQENTGLGDGFLQQL